MRGREQVILIDQCKTNFINQKIILSRLEKIISIEMSGRKLSEENEKEIVDLIAGYSDNYWRIHKILENLTYLKDFNVPLYEIQLLSENKIAAGVNLFTAEDLTRGMVVSTKKQVEKIL